MTKNLNTLIKEREVVKKQLKRLHLYLYSEPEFDIDDLQSRKENIKELNSVFSELQLQIEIKLEKDKTDDQDLDDEFNNERSAFENMYYECLKIMNKKIREFATNNSNNVTLNNTENHLQMKQSNSFLPKIEITPFDGTPINWHAFHDTFKSLVHENNTLQPVEKFHFLKNTLKGEAANVISALSASAEGYTVAWELLIQKYNKPRLIIQAHLKHFLEIPEISRDTPSNLTSLLETAQLHINALKALKPDVSNWDSFLIYIITSKLDKFSRRAWERSLENDDMPKYDELLTFLKKQARGDELLPTERFIQKNKRTYSHVSVNYKCPVCPETHSIYSCLKFKSLSPKARADAARNAQLCINCLRNNHKTLNCKANGCKICSKKHHTMLHFETNKLEIKSNSFLSDNSVELNKLPITPGSSKTALTVSFDSEVLLGTACIKILDKYNKEHHCRVLLDGGSQCHFITEELANCLDLEKHILNIPFSGLGHNITRSKYYVKAIIKSNTSNYINEVSFVALPQITGTIPSRNVDRSSIKIPRNIKLADPEFHKVDKIDALLGSTIFYNLLQVGQIKLCNNSIILQKTQLGWITTGEAAISKLNISSYPISKCLTTSSLDLQMQKFWELEELQNQKFLSEDESACELHFAKNTRRDQIGRYIVRIPFKNNNFKLEGSFNLALKRFYSLERKLEKDQMLYDQYKAFLAEYLNLGHMKNITDVDNCNLGFYLPHHPVFKESSLTTKLRVVFDASAKDCNNVSLNNTMMTGPTIQNDLVSIILRFRTHKYVLTADIEKMFRQIIVDERDTEYQKIFWRNSKNEPVQVFKLTTVTYGMTAAPFLAVRCLKQLADDDGLKYPLAANVLVRDFYMDDLLTGTNDYNKAILLKEQLIKLLELGGFNLRQWSSNDHSLVKDVSSTNQSFNLDYTDAKKVLGIQWNPVGDTIHYSIQNYSNSKGRLTKRIILSEIAQLFDPLGLLSPVVVIGKIIMQELWKANLNWDESIPLSLHTEWLNLKQQLPQLNQLQISRKILLDNAKDIHLHGFCDASERAYGACIYLRTTDKSERHATFLVCSKSRVAPIKIVSLPRLELCAAVLLAKLFKIISKALNVNYNTIRFWSDSTIVLNWINKPPHVWNTFVANRVSIIQNNTKINNWYHISSGDNPADYISRGQMPCELINNDHWFHGPLWFSKNECYWPIKQITEIEVPETRVKIALSSTIETNSLLTKFSSINKLNRIVAYCLRWVSNYRNHNKKNGELSAQEIQNAHMRIIKLIQQQNFNEEIKYLSQDKNISNKSKILSLSPFIDSHGILRVGGRLDKSKLNYCRKHLILLPKNCHITELIIRNTHKTNYHTGIETTINLVRQQYWPVNGKSLTRRIIYHCIICRKANPLQINYLMGSLPENRVTESRPFTNVGIDYCGPFLIKEKKFRNRNSIKAYVVVFVCFAIKAVHFELTTDLTTDLCLAAIKRFFGRRGKSKNIYSDNATNFVGTNNEIKYIQNLIQDDNFNKQIHHTLADEGVNWHFIPPRSPHFGGLWEAGVKSFKKHLYRSIGKSIYTYEEFNTFIIDIEAILNSRPLTPLSSDPNDLCALTAGHFLIGDSLKTLPETNFNVISNNRLSQWQQLQKIKKQFWTRWHNEYLNNLNNRHKWHRGDANIIKIGTLVTIKEDNTPPMCWKLGRIIDLHPGDDNIIRVVTIKTANGIYKRSTKCVAPLPLST